tara:strand:+ start:68 stop:262 length:195 start_codon:yes stop_codon:yes gene_type:complete
MSRQWIAHVNLDLPDSMTEEEAQTLLWDSLKFVTQEGTHHLLRDDNGYKKYANVTGVLVGETHQ